VQTAANLLCREGVLFWEAIDLGVNAFLLEPPLSFLLPS